MDERLDRVMRRALARRPQVQAPPGFAGRVMAHVRERSEQALEGWFMHRVAWPLMAGGGAASLGFGVAWLWLWQAGMASELALVYVGNPLTGF